MRDALKGGKNLPVKVYSDNAWVIVDESKEFSFTLWDDTNGILYYFRLMDVDQSPIPNNSEQAISVVAIDYTYIQTMEVAPMPLKFFDDVCTSMRAESPDMVFTEDFQKHIKYVFERGLNDKEPDLDAFAKNAAHGYRINSVKDSYYDGLLAQPFKETHTMDLEYRNRIKTK